MSKAKQSERCRGFCFTLNNYSDEEYQNLLLTECVYVVIGKEVGESGTPHLQGFIQFKDPKSFGGVKLINARCHWEMTRGNIDQNYAYCTKDGNFEERGIKPVSQKRKGEMERERYSRARQLAKKGDFDAIDDDLYIKHMGNIKKIRAENQVVPPSLSGELENLWLWGPPGSGKTTRAYNSYPGAYLKGLHKWWDGYMDQETVIIDDMDPYHKSLAQHIKVWGHHFAFPAEVKGGSLCIRPKRIIITSNYCIDQVWEDEVTREAMHRRFKEEYIGLNTSDSVDVGASFVSGFCPK